MSTSITASASAAPAPVQLSANKAMAVSFSSGIKPVGFLSFVRTLASASGKVYEKTAHNFVTYCLDHGKEPELSSLLLYIHFLREQKNHLAKTL
jgi:hypothetical protein